MYLITLRVNQHHASSTPILIGSTVHVEDPLSYVFSTGCGVLTVSRLNHFHCLSITHHPSYFGCIDVGELYYKVSKGLPLNYHLGAITYIELPQIDCPLEEPTRGLWLLEHLAQRVVG